MRHFEDLGAVTRAELGVLNADAQSFFGARRRHGQVGHRHRQPPDRRGLARETDVAQAVGAVRGDLEIDHRDAVRFHAGDLEAAQRDLAGDALRIAGDGHELRQPGQDDSHSGNCSRKRRSFS